MTLPPYVSRLIGIIGNNFFPVYDIYLAFLHRIYTLAVQIVNDIFFVLVRFDRGDSRNRGVDNVGNFSETAVYIGGAYGIFTVGRMVNVVFVWLVTYSPSQKMT